MGDEAMEVVGIRNKKVSEVEQRRVGSHEGFHFVPNYIAWPVTKEFSIREA